MEDDQNVNQRKPKSFESSHGDSKNLLHFQSLLRQAVMTSLANSLIPCYQHLDRNRNLIDPKSRPLSSPSFHRQGMGHSIN
ncbi:hypothetical protein E1A91_A03G190300v1 [Gossypium mustelinum]|uniref:Uncharacterized protein n=1 Tax=Gossypium mustelinum TaxID=34275 RepID=A0A5D3A246_GOSMU|nr:hypothetical protein E1A91_A03G190300v1 [Gossypium mustelinum]